MRAEPIKEEYHDDEVLDDAEPHGGRGLKTRTMPNGRSLRQSADLGINNVIIDEGTAAQRGSTQQFDYNIQMLNNARAPEVASAFREAQELQQHSQTSNVD